MSHINCDKTVHDIGMSKFAYGRRFLTGHYFIHLRNLREDLFIQHYEYFPLDSQYRVFVNQTSPLKRN